MEQVISLIIFTFPGLLTFILAQLFGSVPFTNKNDKEFALVAFFLWIPIAVITLVLYQVMVWISHWKFLHPQKDIKILSKEWNYFNEMSDFTILTNNPFFLLYFVGMSILLSAVNAYWLFPKAYNFVFNKINDIRKINKKAPISKSFTVWEKAFGNYEVQIVRVRNSLEEKLCLIGEIETVSGEKEGQKDLLLRHVDHWTKIINLHPVKISRVFIDINSGKQIEIFDSNEALKAQKHYLESLQKTD